MITHSNELPPIPNRVLKSRPGKHLFAPAGKRLWADYLDAVPGFQGRIDFIHKVNIPLLFRVVPDADGPNAELNVEWSITHSRVTGSFRDTLVLDEVKYITEDDVAVSIQCWSNNGNTDQYLRFEYDDSWVGPEEFEVTALRGAKSIDSHGLEIQLAGRANFSITEEPICLAPGESTLLIVAVALGVKDVDPIATLKERASIRMGDLGKSTSGSERGRPVAVIDQPQFALHREESLRWYKQAPRFHTSSVLLNRAWQYRWFILKRNQAEPGLGNLKSRVFYEGRSHKMSKNKWSPEGWEFSKWIPLSTPFHIMDAGWHSLVDVERDILDNFDAVFEPESGLHSATINTKYASYSHFIAWAVWRYHEATGNLISDQLIRKLETMVHTEYELAVTEGDVFVPQYNHRLTGKEFQPSYWYFSGFPSVPNEDHSYTPVKRVDRAVYQYLNVLGVYNLMRAHGISSSKKLKELLDTHGAAINERMWDEDSQFYYDLHPTTDEKAFVKNIVGFYPWWAGLVENSDPASVIRHFGTSEFGSAFGPPSASRDCPAYAPGGGWYSNYVKGPRGCVWNGPNWPYTTGIIVDMLGDLARVSESGHAIFVDMLNNYLLCHFDGHDPSRPYLVEHYNAETGEPISDEPDYNHSFLIDILIRHVAGLTISPSGIVVDPVDIGLEHYELEDLHTRHGIVNLRYIKQEKLEINVGGVLRYSGTPKRVSLNI